jgi:hypothetical protein
MDPPLFEMTVSSAAASLFAEIGVGNAMQRVYHPAIIQSII